MQNVMFHSLRAYYHIRQVIYKKKTCLVPPVKHEEARSLKLVTGQIKQNVLSQKLHKNKHIHD